MFLTRAFPETDTASQLNSSWIFSGDRKLKLIKANNPLLIVLEGIDGSGKSTVAVELQKYLSEKSRKEALVVHNPGALKEKIGDTADYSADADLLVHAADIANTIDKLIQPAMLDGRDVICERGPDSMHIYNVVCCTHTDTTPYLEMCVNVYKGLLNKMRPTATIVLDVDLPIAVRRKPAWKMHPVINNVREMYLALADSNPQNVYKVNANRSLEEVVAECRGIIDSLYYTETEIPQP